MPFEGSAPRICILTDSFYPIIGGGETHVRLLAEKLIERGIPVFVLTRRSIATLKNKDWVGNIHVYRVNPAGLRRFANLMMIIPAFLRLAALRKHYDIIYVSGLRFLGVVGVIASILFRKKCILREASCTELSGGYIWDSPDLPKSKYLRGAISLAINSRNSILKRADSFISISEAIKNEYITCGVHVAKIRHISNGIDTQKFAPVDEQTKAELRKNLGIKDKIIFTYSGKLNRGKGLEFLLKVWKQVAAKRKDVHLMLVGGGANQLISLENELRSYVEQENLRDFVTFTGYTEKVNLYLQSSDYFIFPSESEGLGNALLEALSCGLPAIATRAGGIVDIITDHKNGRLIEVGNELELYGSIIDFLEDPITAGQLGKNGRAIIHDCYSSDRMVDQHILLFQSLFA